eukprot:CAMPEP_0169273434 /NCGR_PEP_ID=MMETSP1016-20121227/51104_1 /TAXON_ID=342587 /ORGANISM="Karlodinium micrum, Strain CCMP2283" /LENGTH=51 /DNA_ID=CAMNT_0009359757 /DNA_START=48 /DNA_END=200 /DNA_ORIENTATION=-
MSSFAIFLACVTSVSAVQDPEETIAALLLASTPRAGSRRQMLAGAGSALAG